MTEAAEGKSFKEYLGDLPVGHAIDRQNRESNASASGKFRKTGATTYEFKGAVYEVPEGSDRFLSFIYIVLYLQNGGTGEYTQPDFKTLDH